MISPDEYIQFKAFARQDGFFLGCLWIFTLGCLVGSVTQPELQIGFVAGAMTTPFAAYFMFRHYRDRILRGVITFKRAFAFNAFMVAYAAIIIAAATFVYFYFIDGGALLGHLQSTLNTPEMKQAIEQTGMNADNIDTQMAMFSQSRPIDLAFGVFFNALLSGLLLALVIGAIGKRQTANQRM